jgi:hypothetical protein
VADVSTTSIWTLPGTPDTHRSGGMNVSEPATCAGPAEANKEAASTYSPVTAQGVNCASAGRAMRRDEESARATIAPIRSVVMQMF